MQGLDESIILFFQSIRCDALTVFFKIFIPLEFWIGFALIVVVYYSFRTGFLRAPIISFFLARDLSTFFYDLAKNFFHRPRPFLSIKGAIPLMIPHGFSMPSGHATLAMASAVVLAHHFPKARKLIYTLAVLTGLSRVYLGVHYLSDVLAGFAMGAILGYLGILLERGIILLAQGFQLNKKALMMIMMTGVFLLPNQSQAKGGDEQDQIILLNDSAAALEDANPALSKGLTQFAEVKEKDWEEKNANKNELPTPMIDKNIKVIQDRISLLKAAAMAIDPTYPLIAKSLRKMANDLNRTIELVE